MEEVLVLEANFSYKEKPKRIEKIYRQFGHVLTENMQKLWKKVNLLNKETSQLIHFVVNNSENCIKFLKPHPRLVVGFAKADDFNQTVSADLHKLQPKSWYIHMVDKFTRFISAAIVRP